MSLGFAVLALTVYAMAVARLVRLINSDTITDPIRVAVERRARDEARSERERARWSTFSYFLTCPWCVSMWVAFATAWAPLHLAHNQVVQYVAVALAVSYLIGVAATLLPDDDVEYETVETS